MYSAARGKKERFKFHNLEKIFSAVHFYVISNLTKTFFVKNFY